MIIEMIIVIVIRCSWLTNMKVDQLQVKMHMCS